MHWPDFFFHNKINKNGLQEIWTTAMDEVLYKLCFFVNFSRGFFCWAGSRSKKLSNFDFYNIFDIYLHLTIFMTRIRIRIRNTAIRLIFCSLKLGFSILVSWDSWNLYVSLVWIIQKCLEFCVVRKAVLRRLSLKILVDSEP
jgi:hypothetical protein